MSFFASVNEICSVGRRFSRRNMIADTTLSQRSVIRVDPLLDKINHTDSPILIAIRNCVTEISPGPFSQKIVNVIL